MKLFPAIALLACGLAGCTSGPHAIDPTVIADLDGVYGYSAQSGGADAVSGRVTLATHPDSSVSGSWELSRVPGSDTTLLVGPQVGTGTLAGAVAAGTVSLNLNPTWADNNVFLTVHASTPGELTGTWWHSTIAGPVASGSVTLLRLTR
jgi:hypothetical protein